MQKARAIAVSEEGDFRQRKFSPGWLWRPLDIALAAHRHFISLFPFLIVLTGVSALLGSKNLATEAGAVLLDAWPAAVAKPIADEMQRVASTAKGGAITSGLIFSVYFSTGAVESLRLGLNRAYGVEEHRSWWLLRLWSMLYVVGGAFSLLAFTLLVLLGPLLTELAERHLHWIAPYASMTVAVRFVLTSVLLLATLTAAHYWLPAGKRRFVDIAPGVLVTLLLWLVMGAGFGAYLAAFSQNYVLTYAGLASVMIALAFLYFSSVIFIFGGELNAAIMRSAGRDER
jgi:membrane protein